MLRVRGSGKDSCRGTVDGGIESDNGSAIAIAVCRVLDSGCWEFVVAPRSLGR